MHGQFQFTIPRRLLCGIVLIAGLAVDSPDAWGQPPRIERVPGNSAPPPARPEAGAPAVRPAPAAASPFGADQVRLPLLPFGGTPKPTRETLKQFDEYVEEIRDTENTLDLVQNRPRLMRLRQTPFRIQLADEAIANYLLVTERELSLTGLQVGTTVLNLWFANPDDPNNPRLLSYLLRVVPDPETRERLERVYEALETEINRNFPDSVVRLSLVGDRLVIRGHARDIEAATQILRIVGAMAPAGPEDIPLDYDDPSLVSATPGVESLTGDPRLPDSVGMLQQPDNYRFNPNANNGNNGNNNRRRRNSYVINMLRVNGVHQVMLKVTVAELSRDALRSLGANTAIGGSGDVGFLSFATSSVASPAAGFFAGPLGGPGGTFLVDTTDFDLALTALKQLGYARALAEPNLTTLNGKPASLQIGGQFPVPQSQAFTNSSIQNVAFVDFGVRLSFIPIVTEGERIRLNVFADISDRDDANAADIGGTVVPSLDTRNFTTQVELRENQTLAVAGLIRNRLRAESSRVPFLGDIPVVGQLFKSDRTSYEETELVVLVTPQLVSPLEAHERPALPTATVFEPSDLEFYLLGRIEGRHAEDYRTPIRSDWKRMEAWRRCQQQYIIGPSGYCEELNLGQ
ncbi:MAG: pilus assembly protein N-terminal domain-containing protein [Pirellulales bacterium]